MNSPSPPRRRFDRRTYAECRSVRELRPAFPRLTQPPTSARWLAGPAFLGAGKFPSEHRCPLPRSPQFRTTQHRGGVSPRSPDPVASVNRPLRCADLQTAADRPCAFRRLIFRNHVCPCKLLRAPPKVSAQRRAVARALNGSFEYFE